MNANSRIRNVEHYLTMIAPGKDFYIVKEITAEDDAVLHRLGFPNNNVGNQILPRSINSVARRNADGYDVLLKNLPKETVVYYVTIPIFGNLNNWQEVSIPRKRYQREHINGYEIELTIFEHESHKYVVSPKLTHIDGEQEKNKHVINLFLSLFGEYRIFDEKFEETMFGIHVKRVNWRLFPQGESMLDILVKDKYLPNNRNKQVTIRTTFKKLLNGCPSECYVGEGGFKGYVAFCFPNRGFTIMENMYAGNATYILGEDWRTISRLTKGEVRSKCLNEDRIEHRQEWENRINVWLNK
ncbi:MAG: hypothetical protein MJZ84_02195 [Paludibacteraceae bacterium]|nr:hypothetical protein [Paludibacteraceae bacterium]